ncbi:NmrA family NAD(P)-binding protein [Mucilaginibacter phyllosphaerae]
MDAKVLITGATGVTGMNAIDRLLELNEPVRAMVHKIDIRSDALAKRGVEIVEGDLCDFDTLNVALRGVDAALFIYPIQSPGLLAASVYFAQAALEENVRLIVNLSQCTSRRMAKSHAAKDRWFAERIFDRSGTPVTHLRPNLYAEWLSFLNHNLTSKNQFISPFGESRYAPIAGEDVGRVIAAILLNPEPHMGQIYPLFGPVELSHNEMAEILSNNLHQKISYEPIDGKTFITLMENSQCSPYFMQHMSAILTDIQDGILAGTSDWVEKITGRKPISLNNFIKKNVGLFSKPV